MNRVMTILLNLLAAFILGCAATKVPVEVVKPAEVDIAGLRKIAVVAFEDEYHAGSFAASLLTQRLMETGYFDIMERAKIDEIMREHALAQAGFVNPETAKEVGQLLGVDGLIFGEVTVYRVEPDERGVEKVTKQVWTGEYERDKDGNIIYEKGLFGVKTKKKKYREEIVDQYYRVRRGTVSVSFRVVDVKTGQLRAVKAITRSYNSGKVSEESYRTLKPQEQILNDLLTECTDVFARIIAPHRVTVHRIIESGEGHIEVGKNFAKQGLWQEAEEAWAEAVKEDPTNPAAYYNLGLAYEVQGKLDEAEASYKKAASLKQKALYLDALANCRRAKQEREKLEKQLEQREL